MKKTVPYLFTLLICITVISACKTGKNNTSTISNKTGWAIESNPLLGKGSNKIGPGLIAIEGGKFIMGGSAVDIPGQDLSNYNYKREVTVSSFYMDETEVSNGNWLEYLNWIRKSFPTDEQYYYEELPDTLVWRNPLSFNEPFVNNYLRHPSFEDYPVVGVSHDQAERYSAWRTDMVNEKLLRDKGYMSPLATATKQDKPFNTEVYLNGQIDDKGPNAKTNLNATATGGAPTVKRNVRLEDGIILQPYRLPTEAEWEYAALGIIGGKYKDQTENKKPFPFNGLGITSDKRAAKGQIIANFKRGKGDYIGERGSKYDGAAFTQNVKSYSPNDFGLYNMAGNVNEWVADVYRSATFEQADALNPFRGNNFQNKDRDPKSGILNVDKFGKPVMISANSGKKQTWAELQANKTAGDQVYNADQRGYRDEQSALYGITTLVNDKSRVYKGGSWNDQAQWLNPATRRYLQQDESSADLGFRCAMTMLGTVNTKK